jgi:hypothetical protein
MNSNSFIAGMFFIDTGHDFQEHGLPWKLRVILQEC